jgi:Tol biopolymer transport system component
MKKVRIVKGGMSRMTTGSRWRTSGLLLLAALASGCGANVAGPLEVQPFQIELADYAPTWSPDGSRIAYIHYRHGSPSTTGIWIVDTAGVATHQILSGDWGSLDWSPDGAHLAISGGSGIFSVKPTGDSLRAITTKGIAPRWSPAGNKLAFWSYDSTGASIWLVSRDGTGLRSLAPTGIGRWYAPDWSPDGSRLVHLRMVSESIGDKVFVMDTTGHAEQQLTTDVTIDQTPAWSPDGQWIAWSRREDGKIWLMKPDGSEAHALSYGGDEGPAWSPDSRRIVFSEITFNIVTLNAIDIATLRVRRITH